MNKSAGKLILALETGIDGGSVAIIEGKRTICLSEGTGSVSRSEDLLMLVSDLLAKNELKKEEIGLIAASDSPGSATGIRIGLSTATGLADALAAKVRRFSVLEAQIVLSGAIDRAISAVYSQKQGIYYRKFRFSEGSAVAETEILNERDPNVFIELMTAQNCSIVLDKNLKQKLSGIHGSGVLLEHKKTQIIVGSLAESIGRAVFLSNASDNKEQQHND